MFLQKHRSSTRSLNFQRWAGYLGWCLILSSAIRPATVIYFITKIKYTRIYRLTIMTIFLFSMMHIYLSPFLHVTYEFAQPIYFRSTENNIIISNTTGSVSDLSVAFENRLICYNHRLMSLLQIQSSQR